MENIVQKEISHTTKMSNKLLTIILFIKYNSAILIYIKIQLTEICREKKNKIVVGNFKTHLDFDKAIGPKIYTFAASKINHRLISWIYKNFNIAE